FGPNAQLDVSGSFHASTADYLRFENNAVFYVDSARQSVLSSARPEAFGFLTANPADISVNGSHFSVSEDAAISLTGGDLNIVGTGEYEGFTAGEILLVGVGAKGEVSLGSPELLYTSGADSGTVDIFGAKLVASKESGGKIVIKGGNININNSSIYSFNAGSIDSDSAGIDIASAFQLNITDDSDLVCMAQGSGAGGDFNLMAEEIILNDAHIYTTSKSEGDGGDIIVDCRKLKIENEATVRVQSESEGAAGAIQIEATDSVVINGTKSGSMYSTGITASTSYADAADAGDITISTDLLEINNGVISSSSYGVGDTGNIVIRADSSLNMKNGNIYTAADEVDGGNIDISTENRVYLINSDICAGVNGGPETKGGNVYLNSGELILNNSRVVADAVEGWGGNISIFADIYLADSFSIVDASSELGIDGMVDINAPLKNLSGSLKPLPTEFMNAASLLKEPCEARVEEGDYGSFIIKGRDSLPMEPGALLISPPVEL
ncbi:MAG: hypothetical protein PVI90_07550, partial [Desulfobacteraceae bacterium]